MTIDLANFNKKFMEHLQKAIPVLASLDIAKTDPFHQKKMGFKMVWKNQEYAILDRDKIVIYFWKCLDKIQPVNTGCYVKVQTNASLSHAMPANNVVHPNAHFNPNHAACRNSPFCIRVEIALNLGR
ncbi:MAG: hypothetical protein MUO53_08895 [Maribacter sp.]|nr:hypothetical protein [Maribacter sp.]